jgi:valyl-tRNA synthetase
MRRASHRGLSPFEELTAGAFLAFRDAKVDIAVIETGMGGRLDATNVVSPILSIITRIGIDHTAFLGNTLEAIAAEKGGIIKAGVPVVVSGQQDSESVIQVLERIQISVNPGSPLHIAKCENKDFRVANASTARKALQILSERFPQLDDSLIEEGLRTTRWPGRFEHLNLSLLGGSSDALLDGAHNVQSLAALNRLIELEREPATFIIAMTQGKDADMFRPLLSSRDTVFAVEFEAVDGMPWVIPESAEILAKHLGGISYGTNVGAAIQAARGKTIICGSLYLIGQIHRMRMAAEIEHNANIRLPKGAYSAAEIEAWADRYWSERSSIQQPFRNTALEPSSKRFLLPPPNVTGSLHIGHALTIAIQDAYVRFYKGQGESVMWLPGTDHAGIATETVVARSLAKQGIDARSLSDEDFVQEIWRYKERFGAQICNQIKRLGADLDWSAEYFTMDDERSQAVVEAFGQLWKGGLIRRDTRMVNWSDSLQSVISDVEVETITIDKPTMIQGAEFGKIYIIAYHLEDGSGFVKVQTTRPETVPGDRAIAVHPKDARFESLVGKRVKHPLLPEIFLPVVADEMVDPKFGTGAVKLTPAHDADDYAASRRHDIEHVLVFDCHGKFLPSCGIPELVGQDRLHGRQHMTDLLSAAGALLSIDDHMLRLGVCSRTGAVIEPRLMPQWFVNMQPLADQVLARDDIRMSPRTKKEFRRWLENIQDWCVSRQIAWGHRIPLYRRPDSEDWFFARSLADAQEAAGCQNIIQDPDVLDTWFSSGLLPLSAFGWPRADFTSIEPLHFIESGPDILFFWLARMAMLCTHLSGSSPFKEVLLHPLVRDSHGRKMSKSLGNVLDPLHLIDGCTEELLQSQLRSGNLSSGEVDRASKEIARNYPQGIKAHGADALRFALLDSTVQEMALNLDIRNVKAGSYLCTKLWNVVNFIDFYEQEGVPCKNENLQLCSIMDTWIQHRLVVVQEEIREAFDSRMLHRATASLRAFIVNDLCDTYLEFVKYDLQRLATSKERRKRLTTLRQIADALCVQIRPFMPFIADTMWHKLGHNGSAMLVSSTMLASQLRTDAVAEDVAVLQQILRELRAHDRPKGKHVSIVCDAESMFQTLTELADHIRHLSKLSSIQVVRRTEVSATIRLTTITHGLHIIVDQAEAVSLKAEDGNDGEQARKRLEYLKRKHSALSARLNNEAHRARAPRAVLDKEEAQLQSLLSKIKAAKCAVANEPSNVC